MPIEATTRAVVPELLRPFLESAAISIDNATSLPLLREGKTDEMLEHAALAKTVVGSGLDHAAEAKLVDRDVWNAVVPIKNDTFHAWRALGAEGGDVEPMVAVKALRDAHAKIEALIGPVPRG